MMEIVHEYMPYGSVLVVDDMKSNTFMAERLMEPYGLEIDAALSGYEAIDKIRAGASYDIVFMDYMMPGIDGMETVKILRDEGYARPIVAFTANTVAGQTEIFLENGFDDFVPKPIDIRQLNHVLNTLIRDKQAPETLSEARRQKERLATTDALTHISNRRGCWDTIE